MNPGVEHFLDFGVQLEWGGGEITFSERTQQNKVGERKDSFHTSSSCVIKMGDEFHSFT